MIVKVEGLAKLSRELKAVSVGLAKDLKRGLKKGADIVADETRATAPVQTGRLAASIKTGATMKDAYVRTGGRLPYAKPIVFGWPGHNIAPHPFPFQARDTKFDEVVEVVRDAVRDVVEKNVRSGTGE